jgi:peptidoglycan/LPS O-acetylase OafA/YrhL
MIGSANGIYYFVFVISYLYAFGLVLRNLPDPLVKWAWGLSFTGMLSYYLFWPHLVLPSFTFEAMFRSPLVHTLPFLTGWVASQHYPSIRPFLSRVKSRYVATMLGIDLAVVMLLQNFDNEIKSRELLIQLHIYLWLTAVMVLSIQMKLNSRWITYFSLSSYGIYLTHIIFVDQFNRLLHKYESPSLPLQIILSCVLVTGLTVLLLEIVKRSAGRYAEFLVGVKA